MRQEYIITTGDTGRQLDTLIIRNTQTDTSTGIGHAGYQAFFQTFFHTIQADLGRTDRGTSHGIDDTAPHTVIRPGSQQQLQTRYFDLAKRTFIGLTVCRHPQAVNTDTGYLHLQGIFRIKVLRPVSDTEVLSVDNLTVLPAIGYFLVTGKFFQILTSFFIQTEPDHPDCGYVTAAHDAIPLPAGIHKLWDIPLHFRSRFSVPPSRKPFPAVAVFIMATGFFIPVHPAFQGYLIPIQQPPINF